MSYGRCVIASDLPELKDVLGDDGLFFEAGSADSLRETIAYALANPDLVERRGRQLKTLARTRHDWDTIYQQYRTAIDRVSVGT
jgi:glycosyltransferase involved in cell wall biosynthesis